MRDIARTAKACGCGCVLHRDPALERLYSHDSPYTYFTSDELDRGEISLECSRPGAVAVALWATQRLLPLVGGGEFAQGLSAARAAALELHRRLVASAQFRTVMPPELDIVVWAPEANLVSEISRLKRTIFDQAAKLDPHLSVTQLPAERLRHWWPQMRFDQERVSCLRACLMQPEHGEWLNRICERPCLASAAAGSAN